MKKIFIAVLVLTSLFIVSSCTIPEEKHSITFVNDTDLTTNTIVLNWQIEDDEGTRIAENQYNVDPGEQSSIDNIPEGSYKITYTIPHPTQLGSYLYCKSHYVDLDEDLEYSVKDDRFYSR